MIPGKEEAIDSWGAAWSYCHHPASACTPPTGSESLPLHDILNTMGDKAVACAVYYARWARFPLPNSSALTKGSDMQQARKHPHRPSSSYLWLMVLGWMTLGLLRAGACDVRSAPTGGAAPEPPGEPISLPPVVVSAGRVEQRLSDVPTHTTVLTQDDIERSAAQTVDDLLREVPGFSLFRRSSSLVANPTTQGVSLRGIGPSGVSRTLVLLDGVPLNDPFGGWVYWSKVPLESIERIEIVRGGGSALYGNYALGGVLNIVTRKPQAIGLQGLWKVERMTPYMQISRPTMPQDLWLCPSKGTSSVRVGSRLSEQISEAQ
jgi:TonB-dependent Receptor Plug Domain